MLFFISACLICCYCLRSRDKEKPHQGDEHEKPSLLIPSEAHQTAVTGEKSSEYQECGRPSFRVESFYNTGHFTQVTSVTLK